MPSLNSASNLLGQYPVQARVIPYVVFVLLTVTGGWFGEEYRYWAYLLRTLAGAGLLWVAWPVVREMRWRWSGSALGAGLLVFGLWVGLDGLYPRWGAPPTGWNPLGEFGEEAVLAWFFVAVRLLGSSLVVPPMEEVFYRSFLYRYLMQSDFLSVPLERFKLTPFLVSSLVFGFAHYDWLSGVLCGFVYQGLVCWKGRLGDAMTAHAITNFLLGLWVVTRGAWHLW